MCEFNFTQNLYYRGILFQAYLFDDIEIFQIRKYIKLMTLSLLHLDIGKICIATKALVKIS